MPLPPDRALSRPGLLRALTTRDVIAIGVNGVIGGGIFLAPAVVARLAGTWATFAYLFSGALVALIALCFAEVGGRFREAGGPFLYAQKAFGPFAGFQVGWFTWIARVTSLASLANGLVTYAAWLAPPLGSGAGRVAVLAGLFALLTGINVRGVAWGAWTIDVLTIVKLAPLALFVLVGMWHIAPERLLPAQAPDPAGFSEAALFLIYVFSGFEVLTFPASEMVDPRRAVPRAIFSTMAIVAACYLSVQIVAMGTLPDLAASAAPLASAAGIFLGAAGAALISVGALISIFGTEGGLMLTTPRLVHAMAEHGHLPALFSRVHERWRTPWVAIVAQGGVALALAIAGTFEELAKLSAIARIVSYAATCLALPAFRRSMGASDSFRVPGGSIISVAATLLCAGLVAASSRNHLLMGAAAFAAGYGLYALRRLSRQATQSP